PPRLQIDFEPQLAHDSIRDAVVPPPRVHRVGPRTDLREIDDGRELPFAAKRTDRARHQARLAGRTRPEHVAKALRRDALEQLAIGLALDIARPVRLHGSTDDEKLL